MKCSDAKHLLLDGLHKCTSITVGGWRWCHRWRTSCCGLCVSAHYNRMECTLWLTYRTLLRRDPETLSFLREPLMCLSLPPCVRSLSCSIQGFPHISAVLLDSARSNNPPDICSCRTLKTHHLLKSEVSQLPQRRGLFWVLMSTNAPVSDTGRECRSRWCHRVLWFEAAPVSGSYIWGLLSRSVLGKVTFKSNALQYCVNP